jgi:hypothetical protein
LQVYGSNFVDLVKTTWFKPKKLIIQFVRDDCSVCEWAEAFFDQIAQELKDYEGFVFARMDVSQNLPTADFQQFVDGKNPE